jgi:hypothetical protein
MAVTWTAIGWQKAAEYRSLNPIVRRELNDELKGFHPRDSACSDAREAFLHEYPITYGMNADSKRNSSRSKPCDAAAHGKADERAGAELHVRDESSASARNSS